MKTENHPVKEFRNSQEVLNKERIYLLEKKGEQKDEESCCDCPSPHLYIEIRDGNTHSRHCHYLENAGDRRMVKGQCAGCKGQEMHSDHADENRDSDRIHGALQKNEST